ncbi:MAG: hypothetical protein ACRBFS_16510 [Aureispira sp.]
MKTLLLLLLLFPLLSWSQEQVSISNKNPWLFEHIEKTLYLETCSFPLSELSVYSNQTGKLELQPDGAFKVKPRSGNLYLNVFKYQGQDSFLVKTIKFTVKALPQPIATLHRLTKGSLSKNEFLAQLGITVELINYDYNIRFPIEKFTLLVVKNQQLVYFKEYEEARFPRSMKRDLGSILQGGEQVFITNIVFRSPYHQHHTANSIALIIKPSILHKN